MKKIHNSNIHPMVFIKQNSFSVKILLFVVVGIFCLSDVKSQESKPPKKIKILPVPSIGYSPETKTYVGAVTLFTFNLSKDTVTRVSNAKVEFNYTWNKQLIFESGWNYFSPGEKWFTRGLFHISKYPDLYYGIGYNTPDYDEVNFQSNRFIFDADVFRNLKNKLFLGGGLSFTSYGNIKYLSDSLYYPELESSMNLGARIIFLKDARNNILTPTKGDYFEFSSTVNFSSSVYFKTVLDYRYYFQFGEKDKHVIASRFYYSGVFGNPPFYNYSLIGGDKYVRGYYLGRYRDNNFSTLQTEFRNHIFWRLGVSVFGGISMVYEKINEIQKECFKPNAGVGLRFLVDKTDNTNLRIDYAVGNDNQSGFYISFGESF